eukprot:jgi/Tetstr1/440241/TSEL_028592.t1
MSPVSASRRVSAGAISGSGSGASATRPPLVGSLHPHALQHRPRCARPHGLRPSRQSLHAARKEEVGEGGRGLDEQRQEWAAAVRAKTGRQKQRVWDPNVLDPPALLADIVIVLVRTKRPVTVGTVARACSSFECEDIRMVAPDCDPLQKSSRNASCGAQYLLHRLRYFPGVTEAVADCDLSVAFSRWSQDESRTLRSISELLVAVEEQRRLEAGAEGSATSAGRPRIALVYGREDTGLAEEDILACDKVCSIPIGRLQESLSLSHAVTIPLAQIFEGRLAARGPAAAAAWQPGAVAGGAAAQ